MSRCSSRSAMRGAQIRRVPPLFFGIVNSLSGLSHFQGATNQINPPPLGSATYACGLRMKTSRISPPLAAPPCGLHGSPLCHRPESFAANQGKPVATYTVGGSGRSAFQSVDRQAVRVPESFRGGCSFGGRPEPALSRLTRTSGRQVEAKVGPNSKRGVTLRSQMRNSGCVAAFVKPA